VLPSRFVDELPAANVSVHAETGYGQTQRLQPGGVREGAGRFDAFQPGAGFNSPYASPGWKRAQDRGGFAGDRRAPIEGEARLIPAGEDTAKFSPGQRVFHDKFGYGKVTAVEGAKLTVSFDHSGPKKVIDSFLTAA
jgi:DNA helicase-2/ATP-dependent DNA helicase PcrA